MVEIYIINCLIKLQKLTGTQFIDLLARKYPSTESRLLFSDDTIPTWINPPDTPYKWYFLLMLPPKLPESIRQSRHSLPSASLTPPQPLTWCCCNSRSPPRVSCDHNNEWTTTDSLVSLYRYTAGYTTTSLHSPTNWIWWPGTASLQVCCDGRERPVK